MKAIDGKLRLHIKNNRDGEEIFRITPALYRAAARRHPDTAKRVRASFSWDHDALDDHLCKAHVLVTWDLPTADLRRRAPDLRNIHIIGAGVEHLQPLDWLPRGLALTNNRGVHAPKTEDYVMMALLMLNQGMAKYADDQRARRWDAVFASTIAGRTLAVIGVGALGMAAVRAGKRLGLRVLGVRRRPRPATGVDRMYGPKGIDKVLKAADFVVITTPHTPATALLIDRRRLALMRPSAGLVNLGRAGVVDYAALADALKSGRLAGAVLDVFAPEPLARSDTLWRCPNLIMTPHVSSDDAAHYTPATLDLVFDNLGRLLAGRRLRNRVDPQQGY